MKKRNLPDRYTDLRVEKGISQTELAKELDCNKQYISLIEKGDRDLSITMLERYADFFNVSTDYLLGRTDIKSTDTTVQSICEYTGLSEKALNEIIKCNRHISTNNFKSVVTEEYKFINALNYLLESDDFYAFIQPLACVYKYCRPQLIFNDEEKPLDVDELNEISAKIDEYCYQNYCKLVSYQELAELKLSYSQSALFAIFYELIQDTFQVEEY